MFLESGQPALTPGWEHGVQEQGGLAQGWPASPHHCMWHVSGAPPDLVRAAPSPSALPTEILIWTLTLPSPCSPRLEAGTSASS